MTALKIKICGMRELSNIEDVAKLRPDYMGFIFYPKSPRFVGHDFRLPSLPGIKKVGVFVNESPAGILETVEQFHLDYVQLHGNESVDECTTLKNENVRVIKAFAVDYKFDFRTTIAYEPCCEFFLFDTKGEYFGGNAVAFDWTILNQYNQARPYFLSGGLNENNIMNIEELKSTSLYALDLNSGVEAKPALKDIRKIGDVKEKLKFLL
jgi:phosphoribosylanthranilate isomerase